MKGLRGPRVDHDSHRVRDAQARLPLHLGRTRRPSPLPNALDPAGRAWSGYPLRFFADTTDPQLIYLITGWESVAAHNEWIASEQNQKLLERTKGVIEVEGLAHAEMDSERGDAQFVVWKQWKPREGEGAAAGHGGTGWVVDQKGPLAYSLQGYGSEEEAGDLGAGEESRKTVGAYRLTLN